jgi:hypothetical protein
MYSAKNLINLAVERKLKITISREFFGKFFTHPFNAHSENQGSAKKKETKYMDELSFSLFSLGPLSAPQVFLNACQPQAGIFYNPRKKCKNV